jgi:hypothetical protein
MSLPMLMQIPVVVLNQLAILGVGHLTAMLVLKFVDIKVGMRNVIFMLIAVHNAFNLPYVLLTGMCKQFGSLRSVDCTNGETYLIIHAIFSMIIPYGYSLYFIEKERD